MSAIEGREGDQRSDKGTLLKLRSIFRLHLETRCLTHDQMRCPCGGNGVTGAGQGAASSKKRSDDEDLDDSDEDDTPPPAKFLTASQVHASQRKEVSDIRYCKRFRITDNLALSEEGKERNKFVRSFGMGTPRLHF